MNNPGANPESAGRERLLRRVVLVVCLLVGLSALWGAFDAVRMEPRVWGLLGFEAVTIVTAGLGVLVGLGRPREAPSLAAACLGATVFASATLGRFSAIVTRAEGTITEGQAVRQLAKDLMFEGRLVAAIALAAVAVLLALQNDRRAWKRLFVCVGMAIPVLGALVWLVGPGLKWLLAPVESTAGLVRVVLALVGGLGVTILGSAAVDQVIRAFQDRLPPLGGARPGRKAGAPAPNKSA